MAWGVNHPGGALPREPVPGVHAGSTGQVVHPRFTYNGTGTVGAFSGKGIIHDPKQKWTDVVSPARPDGSTRLSICKNPKRNATICASHLRTMNVDAPCGSEADST